MHWSPFDRKRERGRQRGRRRRVGPSIIISRLTNPEGRGGMTTIIIQYWGKGRMEEEEGEKEGAYGAERAAAAIHDVGISLGFVDKGGN